MLCLAITKKQTNTTKSKSPMNSRLTALGKFCVKVDDLSLGRPRTNTSGLELIPLEQVCPAHLLRSSGGPS